MLNLRIISQRDGIELQRLFFHGSSTQQQLMYGQLDVSLQKWLEESHWCLLRTVLSRWRWLSIWQEVQIILWSIKSRTLTIKHLCNNYLSKLVKTSKNFSACARTPKLSIFARKCLNLIPTRESLSRVPLNILTWLNSIKRTMSHSVNLLVILTLTSNFSVWRLVNSSNLSMKRPYCTTMLQHSKLTVRIFRNSHKAFWIRDLAKIVSVLCTSRTHKWLLVQKQSE